MHPFRRAAEADDMITIKAMLAKGVHLHTPVVLRPYVGRKITAAILRHVPQTFKELRYVREIVSADGRDLVLTFTTKVNGVQTHGVDILHFNDEGLIDDFEITVRPLSAATALASAMSEQFHQIKRAAELE
ncbi:nuclear transport factor 2 family protein [Nocardiopsis sp. LOL_012]|uniref:nuclear transport factor 2 family protein n=1 Tax=Nocardiopsis sp. LOL_012 TaxID=3345409 RepID=UPI003A8C33C6